MSKSIEILTRKDVIEYIDELDQFKTLTLPNSENYRGKVCLKCADKRSLWRYKKMIKEEENSDRNK